ARMSKKSLIIGACVLVAVICLLVWNSQRRQLPEPASKEASVTPADPQPVAPPEPDALQKTVEDIVARYRKTIILLEGEDSLPQEQREQASLVGTIIFQENHQATSTLSNGLSAEIEAAGDFSKALPSVSRFLDLIETQEDFHDADKLSFREILGDLA